MFVWICHHIGVTLSAVNCLFFHRTFESHSDDSHLHWFIIQFLYTTYTSVRNIKWIYAILSVHMCSLEAHESESSWNHSRYLSPQYIHYYYVRDFPIRPTFIKTNKKKRNRKTTQLCTVLACTFSLIQHPIQTKTDLHFALFLQQPQRQMMAHFCH